MKYLKLFEERKKDLKNLKNKYSIKASILNVFLKHKNAEWLIKMFINNIDNFNEDILSNILIKMVNKFNKNKLKYKIKNINCINSIEELFNIIESEKINDVIIYYNSYEYIIFRCFSYVSTKKMVKQYISNTCWCTAYNKSRYNMHNFNNNIIYCINKLETKKSIALEIFENEIEMWNHKEICSVLNISINSLFTKLNNNLKKLFIENNLLKIINEIILEQKHVPIKHLKETKSFNISDYYHQKIMQFSRDIKIHDLPSKLRVNDGVDSYMVALEQLKQYFSGDLSVEEIKNPDNTLRNIMMLWALDKMKCTKQTPQTNSVGKIRNLPYFENGSLRDGEMNGYIVTILDDYGKPVTKFKTKDKGQGNCVVEIIGEDYINKKANVYYA